MASYLLKGIVGAIIAVFIAVFCCALLIFVAQSTSHPTAPSKAQNAKDAEIADAARQIPSMQLSVDKARPDTSSLSLVAVSQPDGSQDVLLTNWIKSAHIAILRHNRITPKRIDELKAILSKTSLTSAQLLDFVKREAQILPSTAISVIFEEAILRARNALSSAVLDDDTRLLIVKSLNGIKPAIWKVVDAGNYEPVPALYEMNCLIVSYTRPDEQGLRRIRAHGFIGQAETLYLLARLDDAETVIRDNRNDYSGEDEILGFSWINGLILTSKKQFAAAAEALKICSADEDFKHSRQATELLYTTYQHMGDHTAAAAVLTQWRSRYHPSNEAVSKLISSSTMLNATP